MQKNKYLLSVLCFIITGILWAGVPRYSFAYEYPPDPTSSLCGNDPVCTRIHMAISKDQNSLIEELNTSIQSIDISIQATSVAVSNLNEIITPLNDNMSDFVDLLTTYMVISILLSSFSVVMFVYKR